MVAAAKEGVLTRQLKNPENCFSDNNNNNMKIPKNEGLGFCIPINLVIDKLRLKLSDANELKLYPDNGVF